MKASHILFIVCVGTVGLVSSDYINNYEETFTFTCPDGQHLATIQSVHNNGPEDRRFDFQCSKLPVGATAYDCEWSRYVNNWQERFTYESKGFIAGVSSYHSNRNEDRKFKFYSCGLKGMEPSSCEERGWTIYDEVFLFDIAKSKIFMGIESEHDTGSHDRIFKFKICGLGLIDPRKNQLGDTCKAALAPFCETFCK